MKNIVIFASGSGTNAERIIKYFGDDSEVEVVAVLTNNPKAGVIARANKLNVEANIFNRNDFYNTDNVVRMLEAYNPDLLVLAGFLWLVPESLINKYNGHIINIHPALLPKYGGKGMYGMRVHEAVIEAKEERSGITIHRVNNKYDDGQIVFQESFAIAIDETPDTLAQKIHQLEYEHFPRVIEKILK